MNVLKSSLAIFLILCILIGIHSYLTKTTADCILSKCAEAEELLSSENWSGILSRLNDISEAWKSYRIWAAITISTDDIEQIEISFRQAYAFAELEQKSDFIGELTMFSMLVKHISHKEGLHFEEIL